MHTHAPHDGHDWAHDTPLGMRPAPSPLSPSVVKPKHAPMRTWDWSLASLALSILLYLAVERKKVEWKEDKRDRR